MSDKTVKICKLALLTVILALLCVMGYRLIKTGSPNLNILEGDAVVDGSYNGVKTVKVDVLTCAVRVNTHGESDVKVEIRKTGFGLSDKNRPSVKQTADELIITQPKLMMSAMTSGYIVYISVPETSRLDYELNTASGSLRLNAPSENASVTSASGSIKINAPAVNASARSVSGSVEIDAGESARSVSAESASGAVRISVGGKAATVRAATVSGAIRLEIPESSGYTMDYSTVSGSVKDAMRGASYKKSGVATQGGGEIKISANSVSGSIRIDEND